MISAPHRATGNSAMINADLINADLDFGFGIATAGVSYCQLGDGVSDNGLEGRFAWLF